MLARTFIWTKEIHILDPFRNHVEVPGLSCLLWPFSFLILYIDKLPSSCGIWFHSPCFFLYSLPLSSPSPFLPPSNPPFFPSFLLAPLHVYILPMCTCLYGSGHGVVCAHGRNPKASLRRSSSAILAFATKPLIVLWDAQQVLHQPVSASGVTTLRCSTWVLGVDLRSPCLHRKDFTRVISPTLP